MGEHKRKKAPEQGSDQWIRGGNCDVCRRRKFCGKTCAAHERFIQSAISEAMMKTMLTMMAKKK